MGVTYAEEYGSPVDNWGENGSLVARQVLRCAWEERYTLLLEIGGNGGRDYPHATGIGCRARGATIVGVGKNDEYAIGMNKYEDALLTIIYATDGPQGVPSGAFVTEEFLPATDSRYIDIGNLKWDDTDGQRLSQAEAPLYLHGTFTYVLTFHHLLAIPAAALMLNVSNNAPVPAFLFPISFPTETLLHLSAGISQTVGLGMMQRFRLQYRWLFNDQTWAKYQKSDATWHYIYHAKTGAIVKHYPPVDFSAMYG